MPLYVDATTNVACLVGFSLLLGFQNWHLGLPCGWSISLIFYRCLLMFHHSLQLYMQLRVNSCFFRLDMTRGSQIVVFQIRWKVVIQAKSVCETSAPNLFGLQSPATVVVVSGFVNPSSPNNDTGIERHGLYYFDIFNCWAFWKWFLHDLQMF